MDDSDETQAAGPTAGGSPHVPEDWLRDFEAAARRPLDVHIRYSFVKTYRPVMDDEPYRSFDSMEEYRRWCETALPGWLGYGRV